MCMHVCVCIRVCVCGWVCMSVRRSSSGSTQPWRRVRRDYTGSYRSLCTVAVESLQQSNNTELFNTMVTQRRLCRGDKITERVWQ